MILEIPDSVAPFALDLQFFMQMMVRKLHTNRHKGYNADASIRGLVQGLTRELIELTEALQTKGQFEAAVEAVDIANFSFLLCQHLLDIDRPTYEGQRKPK